MQYYFNALYCAQEECEHFYWNDVGNGYFTGCRFRDKNPRKVPQKCTALRPIPAVEPSHCRHTQNSCESLGKLVR